MNLIHNPNTLLNEKLMFNDTQHETEKDVYFKFRYSCLEAAAWPDRSSNQSLLEDPLRYFSFQPMLYNWYNKCRGMYYPAFGIMPIKDPLLLIGKISLWSRASGFPFSLWE